MLKINEKIRKERGHKNMKFTNKKSGFTLAEVLVTLMIIGVIAAMTIPSLMQSTAQQEFRAAYKKAVSMINQAVTLNYALDGRDATDYSGANFIDLMTQRLNVMSMDGTDAMYTADGMWFSTAGSTAGTACNANNTATPDAVCSVVKVDVNGQKGPNKVTTSTQNVFDIFTINIYPQKAMPANATMGQIMYQK